MVRKVEKAETLIVCLSRGGDLLEELTGVARRHDVRFGRVASLGAVEHARFGFYGRRRGSSRLWTWRDNWRSWPWWETCRCGTESR